MVIALPLSILVRKRFPSAMHVRSIIKEVLSRVHGIAEDHRLAGLSEHVYIDGPY